MVPSVSPSAPAGSSTTPSPACQICTKPAIYKCPRCTLRTCSLPCSTTHKSRFSCSGIRDRVAYVPMKAYTWGTMMDDYAYLEEMGRNVSEWGRDISQKGLSTHVGRGARGTGWDTRGRGRGRGRGQSTSKRPRKEGYSKRDFLKTQLEARDIDMELLPLGMTRRHMNQSTWDTKNRTAQLTVEFLFHPPPDPLAPAGSPSKRREYYILTHRNNYDQILHSLVAQALKDRRKAKKEDRLPDWLLEEDFLKAESSSSPLFLIRTSAHPPQPGQKGSAIPSALKVYAKLDASQKMSAVLRGRSFVEFPTIEVWTDEEDFHDTIVDDAGSIARYADQEQPRGLKRRRLDAKGAKQTMKALLGGYGTEEDFEEGNVLSQLGNYAGSDSEDDVEGGKEGLVGESAEDRLERNVWPIEEDDQPSDNLESADEDDEGEGTVDDLQAVVTAMQRDRAERGYVDDEDVDWGNSD